MAKKAPVLQPTIRPVRIFVAYSDCTSASRALAALGRQWRHSGQRVALRPMLWPFRQLTHPRWGDISIRDALHADCVMLATESPQADARVERWLDSLGAHAAGRALSIIVAARGEELWNLSVAGNARSPMAIACVEHAAEVLGSVAARRPAVAAA